MFISHCEVNLNEILGRKVIIIRKNHSDSMRSFSLQDQSAFLQHNM